MCVLYSSAQAAEGLEKDGMITQTTRQMTSLQREKEDLQEELEVAMTKMTKLRQQVSSQH